MFYLPVPLGSTPELPAETCSEVKQSEGHKMADGEYWIYADGDTNDTILATCAGTILGFTAFLYGNAVYSFLMLNGLRHHYFYVLVGGQVKTKYRQVPFLKTNLARTPKDRYQAILFKGKANDNFCQVAIHFCNPRHPRAAGKLFRVCFQYVSHLLGII